MDELEHMRWHRRTEVEAKTAELISKGYTFTYGGKQYTFDTSPDSLSKLGIAYNVAKNTQPYSQAMVMKDYQVIPMDGDSIIAHYEAMIAYGLQIYNTHAQIIEALNNLSAEELSTWVDPR